MYKDLFFKRKENNCGGCNANSTKETRRLRIQGQPGLHSNIPDERKEERKEMRGGELKGRKGEGKKRRRKEEEKERGGEGKGRRGEERGETSYFIQPTR